jgi:hypothetical protein
VVETKIKTKGKHIGTLQVPGPKKKNSLISHTNYLHLRLFSHIDKSSKTPTL